MVIAFEQVHLYNVTEVQPVCNYLVYFIAKPTLCYSTLRHIYCPCDKTYMYVCNLITYMAVASNKK